MLHVERSWSRAHGFKWLVFVSLAHTVFCAGFVQHPIVVTIATHNNKDWYERNLKSVYEQRYKKFRVIIVDDCSIDGDGGLRERFIKKNHQEYRTMLIKNKQRRRSLANHYTMIHLCKPDEIIVNLDGDDFFADIHVLEYINKIYQDTNIWLTYGQFEWWPDKTKGSCRLIDQAWIAHALYRKKPFVFSHVRTYRAWLAQLVKLEDLISDQQPCTGEFFSSASDMAMMYPMLEMAHGRMQYIPRVLYKWNTKTPANNHKVCESDQLRCDRTIRGYPVYESLRGKAVQKERRGVHALIVVNDGRHVESFLWHFACSIKDVMSVDVLYAKKHQALCDGLKSQFPGYRFSLIEGKNAKKTVASMCQKSKVSYFLITTTDSVIAEPIIPLKPICSELDKTFAYTCALSTPQDINIPHQWLHDEFYVWKFKLAGDTWLRPHNFSMSLYRKDDVVRVIKSLRCSSIEQFIEQWQAAPVDGHKVGLFYWDVVAEQH